MNYIYLISLLFITTTLQSCNQSPHDTTQNNKNNLSSMETAQLTTPSGQHIDIFLALNESEQTLGVSGLSVKEFAKNHGMFFFYTQDDLRSFWMPNTHFNLDIFFLDKNLRILAIERNVPHYPKSTDLHLAPTIPAHESRHVLEMRSDSEIAKNLRKNSQLRWNSSPSLWQIESRIHLSQ